MLSYVYMVFSGVKFLLRSCCLCRMSDRSKKRNKVKSLLPVSSSKENSGKATILQDVVEMAKMMISGMKLVVICDIVRLCCFTHILKFSKQSLLCLLCRFQFRSTRSCKTFRSFDKSKSSSTNAR
jgi:hypothetical protein